MYYNGEYYTDDDIEGKRAILREEREMKKLEALFA